LKKRVLCRGFAALLAVTLLMGMFVFPVSAAVPAGAVDEVVLLVNNERAKAGLPPLNSGHIALNMAAQKRARELPLRIDHTHRRPDGRECFTVLAEYGIRSFEAAGENIAAGQKSAAEVMAGWMNSPGHRANILGNYTHIGVGVVESNGRLYWSQEFLRTTSAGKWALHSLKKLLLFPFQLLLIPVQMVLKAIGLKTDIFSWTLKI
jgi:hypothetical protein